MTAANVISVTKAHFARYGVPDKFLSDNGLQYISQEFVNFAKEYDFKLITRSPFNAKATGKVESCVKKAKKMLKKVRSPHRAIRPPEHPPPPPRV